MSKKLKKCVDKGKVFGVFQRHLIVSTINYLRDYLSNRKQRTKIENTYSTWIEIIFGVTQGSKLEPLLFSIFLVDLFFIISDVDIRKLCRL